MLIILCNYVCALGYLTKYFHFHCRTDLYITINPRGNSSLIIYNIPGPGLPWPPHPQPPPSPHKPTSTHHPTNYIHPNTTPPTNTLTFYLTLPIYLYFTQPLLYPYILTTFTLVITYPYPPAYLFLFLFIVDLTYIII